MYHVRLVSIVDDDESSRLAIESLVSSLGWATRTFASAEEYLESLPTGRAGETRCLVSDVRMPGMSGIEMFEHLRTLGAAPPTVFVTAFPTDALRAAVLARGALALLEKPVEPAELKRHLTQALGRP